MEIIPTPLTGLVVLRPKVFLDARGAFLKTFHAGQFRDLGLEFQPAEVFCNVSHRGVIRGLHFQLPPATQARLVTCLSGRLLDVMLDLRRDSATYGQVFSRELDDASREMIFIPAGFAHGFQALTDNTVMLYHANPVHSPAHDTGLRWDSFGFNWPLAEPVVSGRDLAFPAFAEFNSPF